MSTMIFNKLTRLSQNNIKHCIIVLGWAWNLQELIWTKRGVQYHNMHKNNII